MVVEIITLFLLGVAIDLIAATIACYILVKDMRLHINKEIAKFIADFCMGSFKRRLVAKFKYRLYKQDFLLYNIGVITMPSFDQYHTRVYVRFEMLIVDYDLDYNLIKLLLDIKTDVIFMKTLLVLIRLSGNSRRGEHNIVTWSDWGLNHGSELCTPVVSITSPFNTINTRR